MNADHDADSSTDSPFNLADSRVEADGAMKGVVIVLHGFQSSPRHMGFNGQGEGEHNRVVQTVVNNHPDYLVLVPDLPYRSTLCAVRLADIAKQLVEYLDQIWKGLDADAQRDLEICIVGHSIGASVARKIETMAWLGEEIPERGVTIEPAFEWAESIERIVLMAGFNRGWEIGMHLSLLNLFLWNAGGLIGHFMRLGKMSPTIFDIRKGAIFLTQLRLQLLALKPYETAHVTQLLGNSDDMINPEDEVDWVTGGDYTYVEIPKADHLSVFKAEAGSMSAKTADELEKLPTGQAIRVALEAALTGSKENLNSLHRNPSVGGRHEADDEVKEVCLVVHGIRDTGFWTNRLARSFIRKAESLHGPGSARADDSTYGYFGMGPFLFPWIRQRKVEWLLDRYVENRAQYPSADFHFFGHSNGTYMLAKALMDVKGCRFRNVAFAGSIVWQSYDWKAKLVSEDGREPQVGSVLNIVATADWVVGIFPRLFELFPIQKLGSAGHYGFMDIPAEGDGERLFTARFAKGSHGAGLQPDWWDVATSFLVQGHLSPQEIQAADPEGERSTFVELAAFGLFNPIIWLALISLIGVGFPLWLLSSHEALVPLVHGVGVSTALLLLFGGATILFGRLLVNAEDFEVKSFPKIMPLWLAVSLYMVTPVAGACFFVSGNGLWFLLLVLPMGYPLLRGCVLKPLSFSFRSLRSLMAKGEAGEVSKPSSSPVETPGLGARLWRGFKWVCSFVIIAGFVGAVACFVWGQIRAFGWAGIEENTKAVAYSVAATCGYFSLIFFILRKV